MRRTTSPRPPRARHLPRALGLVHPVASLRAAAVLAATWATLPALPATAQEGPVRQNRPAGEPPPARADDGPSAVPATRPATEPAAAADPAAAAGVADVGVAAAGEPFANLSGTELRAALTKSFADLAHPDPAVREAARVRLMGMTRDHLPTFEAVVRGNLPLAPTQAIALRELVTQVYLAGEPYPSSKTEGFLGVRLAEVNVGARAAAADDAAANAPPAREGQANAPAPILPPGPFDPAVSDAAAATSGVAILERMPGFCGARMFQDGDVVLAIAVGRRQVPTRTTFEMRSAVVEFGAGQVVRFVILRQGQIIRVPIALDPKPTEVDPLVGVQPLIDARRTAAEAYWSQTFGPILKERAG